MSREKELEKPNEGSPLRTTSKGNLQQIEKSCGSRRRRPRSDSKARSEADEIDRAEAPTVLASTRDGTKEARRSGLYQNKLHLIERSGGEGDLRLLLRKRATCKPSEPQKTLNRK